MRFSLSELRKSLDNIDEAIVVLLAERFNITRKIGRLKAKKKLSAQDKKREDEKFSKLEALAKKHDLNPGFIKKLYRLIMDEVIKEHKKIKRNLEDD